MMVIFKILYKIFILNIFVNYHHKFISSKIVIPFSFYNSNPDTFIINYSDNVLYTEVKAGSYDSSPDGKKIIIFLNFRNSQFLISPRTICPKSSFYNINDSLSYEYKNNISQDSFYLYTDIQTTSLKKFEKIPFSYTKGNRNNTFCGDMGFNPIIYKSYQKDNLIHNLKQFNYIDNYYVSFEFNEKKPFDNYENLKGKLIIGELPHIYDKKTYFSEQFFEDTINLENNQINLYQLKMDNLFAGLKSKEKISLNYNEDILVNFEINYGLISGPEYYRDFIENAFFNKTEIEKICKKTNDSGSLFSYDIYVCDNSIKSKFDLFPEISFYSNKFDYNFTFNYEDLFMLKNNKYYFKIIFVGGGYNIWRFGLPFLLKYKLIFNHDSKRIGFYNNNLKINKPEKKAKILTNIWFWIIILIVLLIIVISTFFITKTFFGTSRRKMANELDDGFDYEAHKGDKNINNGNDNKNKLFENDNEDNN